MNMTTVGQKADGNQKIVTELDACSMNCSKDFIHTLHMFGNLGKVHLLCLDLLLYSPSSICYWQLSKEDLGWMQGKKSTVDYYIHILRAEIWGCYPNSFSC